jgi:hypothetical protein
MSDTALIQLDAARLALSTCRTAMEAKQIADAADVMRVYLARTHASAQAVNQATEIRLLAERQMGEFLKEMPKAKGTAGAGRPSLGGAREEPPKTEDAPATLADMGISKKQSARAQKLADISPVEFAERIEAAKDEGKLTTAAIITPPAKPVNVGGGIEIMNTPMHPISARPLSAASQTAAEQAERDSESLWLLKSTWRKTTKKDRAAFIEWAKQN